MKKIDSLASRAKNDKKANDELYTAVEEEIKSAACLVVSRFRKINYDDFYQECYLLYLKAVKNYNPEFGRFIQYLKTVILNEGATYCLSDRIVKIPRSYVLYYGDEMRGIHRSRNSQKILDSVNAKFVGYTEGSYTDIIQQDLMLVENSEIVKDAVMRLPKRNRFVIKNLYGIGCPRKTVYDLSVDMGVTPQRVSQLRKRSLLIISKIIGNDYNPQDFFD